MSEDIGYNLRRQFGADMLDSLVDWMRDNLSPSEVFNDDQLTAWAKEREPEDVFSDKELEAWATENGFTKSDD